MKKLLALTLALILVVLPLAGCGSKPETSTPTPVGVGTDTPKETQKEMEKVKYTVMISGSYAEYPPDGGEAKGVLQEAWEKQLGITNTDYEVIAAAGGDYNTKLNAMMSGGDVPDYFNVKIEELGNLVKNGIIVPVDDYVAQMPHFQELLKVPGNKVKYDNLMIDGKHYELPQISLEGSLNGPGVSGLMMRTDWLEKLTLKAPNTLEELHDVLVAFTTKDPDGNGKNDTYGLSGNKDQMFSSIFGAYGVYLNGINSWMEVDGKLVHSTTLPQVKNALETLRQWYSEGIIDPDKFVIEAKQTKDKFIAGQIGSYENTVWWANDARVAWKKSNPTATCAFVNPPKGPEGVSGYPVNLVGSNANVISQNCVDKNDVNRLVKILDWMVDDSDEGGMRLVQYGIEGENYTFDREKNVIDNSIMGDAATMYKLGYSNPVRWINVVDRRWIAKGDPREIDFQISGDSSKWVTTQFTGTVPAMKEYPDLYNKLWSEYFTKIVTGALPVSEFDVYVDKFYSQGGKELTEQVNAAWKKP